jgi:hypothetical protein
MKKTFILATATLFLFISCAKETVEAKNGGFDVLITPQIGGTINGVTEVVATVRVATSNSRIKYIVVYDDDTLLKPNGDPRIPIEEGENLYYTFVTYKAPGPHTITVKGYNQIGKKVAAFTQSYQIVSE